jgi:hypothetical protein
LLRGFYHKRALLAAIVGVLFAGGVLGADFNVPFQPRLSLTRGINNSTVTYRGQTNFQYIIYVSSNATTWSSLLTNVCTSSVMNHSDTNRPIRFYKAAALKTPLLYQCTFSGIENGQFIIFVRTNDTAMLVGFISGVQGAFENSLLIGADNRVCGTIFANRTGCLLFSSNSVSGSLSNGATRTATVSGLLKSNSGPFQTAAGVYSGTYSLSCDGTIKGILAPDGTLFFYTVNSFSAATDGGIVGVNGDGSFSLATTGGSYSTHYTGALRMPQRLMEGGYQHGCDGNSIGVFSTSILERLFR